MIHLLTFAMGRKPTFGCAVMGPLIDAEASLTNASGQRPLDRCPALNTLHKELDGAGA